MNNYHQVLMPGESYHLFSRAIGEERLFLSAEHYHFFLRKVKQHTAAVCEVYCYTLLPNHFHLLVRIKEHEAIVQHFKEIKKRAYEEGQDDLPDFVMERFSNCLNSYTKSFNKVNSRKGALFMDYMKRSKVCKETDFTNFIWYIHKNAVHHQLVKQVGDWPHDSYRSLLSEAPTSLLRDEVIAWFGGREEFIQFHQQAIDPKINL